jgi:hypothetical protein
MLLMMFSVQGCAIEWPMALPWTVTNTEIRSPPENTPTIVRL